MTLSAVRPSYDSKGKKILGWNQISLKKNDLMMTGGRAPICERAVVCIRAIGREVAENAGRYELKIRVLRARFFCHPLKGAYLAPLL